MKIIRGITCGDTRRIVGLALEAEGWTYAGVTKGGHGILVWQPEGALEGVRIYFAMTPGDCNAWKLVAKEIEKVSGLQIVNKTKRKAGRRIAPVVVESAKAKAERERFQAEADARAVARYQARAAEREALADARRAREYGPLMRASR